MTRYGFRVVGGCDGERRLIDWSAALAAHAACDERADVNREGYLSAFTFGNDFREYLDATGSPKGYIGPCGSDWLWFDLDAAGDVERALRDARRLAAGLVERFGLDDDDLLIFFSGSKGFHVGLPLSVCGSPGPSLIFPLVAKTLATGLAELLGATIDQGVYDRQRLFRAPNSRHPKTGLHKRRVTFDELLRISLDGILGLAVTAEPFDVPRPPESSPQGIDDWTAAVERVEKQRTAQQQRRTTGGPATLNRATLDFIREGATTGDRHRLLFAAAANLAEFDCPPALAHALLTEAARDSGLTPSDTRRQIDCGLNHSNAKGTT